MKRPVKRICHLIFGLRISGKEQTDLGNRKWQRMAREMEEAKKMNLKKSQFHNQVTSRNCTGLRDYIRKYIKCCRGLISPLSSVYPKNLRGSY